MRLKVNKLKKRSDVVEREKERRASDQFLVGKYKYLHQNRTGDLCPSLLEFVWYATLSTSGAWNGSPNEEPHTYMHFE